MKRKLRNICCFSLTLFFLLPATLVLGASIERMTKEQLKERMTADDVVIVDVRTGRDWKSSEFKIQGAVRVAKDIVRWAAQYSSETKLVLYCA